MLKNPVVAIAFESDFIADQVQKNLENLLLQRDRRQTVVVESCGAALRTVSGIREMLSSSHDTAKSALETTGALVGIGCTIGEVRLRRSGETVTFDTIITCAVSKKHLIMATFTPHSVPEKWAKEAKEALSKAADAYIPAEIELDDRLILDIGALAAKVVATITGVDKPSVIENRLN